MAINTDFFDTIDMEQKAYWLGFIYADGHLSPSRFRRGAVLTINLKASDASHLRKLADIFGREVKDRTCIIRGKEYQYARLDVCSNQIVRAIIEKGIPYRKTLNNDVTVLNNVPENLKHHFIRGVFDGDGNIHKRHTKREDCLFSICGTERFIEDVREYMCSILELSRTKLTRGDRGFTIVKWGGKYQPIRIRNWLYDQATVYLQRKRDIFDSISIEKVSGRCSQYRGVTRSQFSNKWEAKIGVNRKHMYLGSFDTPEEAAFVYDNAARQYRGNMAIVNFPNTSLTIKGGESKKYK